MNRHPGNLARLRPRVPGRHGSAQLRVRLPEAAPGAALLVAAPPPRRARDRPLDGALHRRRELRRVRHVVRPVGPGNAKRGARNLHCNLHQPKCSTVICRYELGVQKSEHFADVIYESPLTPLTQCKWVNINPTQPYTVLHRAKGNGRHGRRRRRRQRRRRGRRKGPGRARRGCRGGGVIAQVPRRNLTLKNRDGQKIIFPWSRHVWRTCQK